MIDAIDTRAVIGLLPPQTSRPIGPLDLMIAGQARPRNLTLIANNVGKFSRVDGLRVQDWQV